MRTAKEKEAPILHTKSTVYPELPPGVLGAKEGDAPSRG